MRYRLTFLLVAAFFVTMNVLLWRSEFAAKSSFGTPVPAMVVWEKMVTSPDNSWLEIRHRGTRVGRAHWVATIQEEYPAERVLPPTDDEGNLLEELPPEGMVRAVTGYTLDFDGNVALDELTRLRFSMALRLDTNQLWRELNLKFQIKPFSLEVAASAAREELRLVVEEEARKEYVYSFADLRNPDKILRDIGGPLLPTALGALSLSLRGPGRTDPALGGAGFLWDARQDRLQLGRTDLRVYRLEARLMGRYTVVMFVSPVGEVLRVELPDDVVMMNEALTSL